MNFENTLTDAAVFCELGRRVMAERLAQNLTQAQFAEAAGISKRTLERLEDGEPTQLSNLIRVLRALNKLTSLEALLPVLPASPIDLVERQGKVRKRASGSAAKHPAKTAWVWAEKS